MKLNCCALTGAAQQTEYSFKEVNSGKQANCAYCLSFNTIFIIIIIKMDKNKLDLSSVLLCYLFIYELVCAFFCLILYSDALYLFSLLSISFLVSSLCASLTILFSPNCFSLLLLVI